MGERRATLFFKRLTDLRDTETTGRREIFTRKVSRT